VAVIAGCSTQGEGPGHRDQPLALTPEQELQLGREAYEQLRSEARLPQEGPEVDRVRRVSQRIAGAVRIESNPTEVIA